MSESICLQCENKRICKTGIHQPSANVTVNGCSRFEQKEKQTNADRIRAMSDEELADWVWGAETAGRAYGPRGKKAWLDWLKQEVTTNSTT